MKNKIIDKFLQPILVLFTLLYIWY